MGKSTCCWCFMRQRQTLSKGRQLQSTVSAPKGRVTFLVINISFGKVRWLSTMKQEVMHAPDMGIDKYTNLKKNNN